MELYERRCIYEIIDAHMHYYDIDKFYEVAEMQDMKYCGLLAADMPRE